MNILCFDNLPPSLTYTANFLTGVQDLTAVTVTRSRSICWLRLLIQCSHATWIWGRLAFSGHKFLFLICHSFLFTSKRDFHWKKKELRDPVWKTKPVKSNKIAKSWQRGATEWKTGQIWAKSAKILRNLAVITDRSHIGKDGNGN